MKFDGTYAERHLQLGKMVYKSACDFRQDRIRLWKKFATTLGWHDATCPNSPKVVQTCPTKGLLVVCLNREKSSTFRWSHLSSLEKEV